MTADNLSSGGVKPSTSSSSFSRTATTPRNNIISTTNDATNNPNLLFPSSKIKLLHQRTSLSLAYNRDQGRWGYQGETALYIVIPPTQSSQTGNETANTNNTASSGNGENKNSTKDKSSSSAKNNVKSNNTTTTMDDTTATAESSSTLNDGDNNKSIELALHLRDGCCHVDSVEIYGAASSATNDNDRVGETTTTKSSSKRRRSHPISQSTTTQQQHYLRPLPQHSVSYSHHDPLSIFMTSPSTNTTVAGGGGGMDGNIAALGEDEQDISADKTEHRRYQADAHCTRGAKGMTYSLRAASISSALGELRITIAPTAADVQKDGAPLAIRPPLSKAEAHQCWKEDLAQQQQQHCAAAVGETPPGTMERKMNDYMQKHRCLSRREARLELVAKSLSEATATTTTSSYTTTSKVKDGELRDKWPLSRAMKIVIRFSMVHSTLSRPDPRLHLGGIIFVAPPPTKEESKTFQIQPSLTTPHVYTICGTHGDHQGVRSWLPTLDSASPKHRASHELIVKVTSRREEGLWPCASGEDFGCNRSVSHPILFPLEKDDDIFEQIKKEMQMTDENDDDVMLDPTGVQDAERAWMSVEDGISHALGYRHARFVKDFFHGSSGSSRILHDTLSSADYSSSPTSTPSPELNCSEIIAQKICRNIRPNYVTSIFSSLTWLPCPSRSLGFAVGPFATLYDPEYFRLSLDDDDDDDDEDDDDSNAETPIRTEERDTNDAKHGETVPSSSRHHSLDLHETALKLGEGIRQLYFAPREDRRWIHEYVNDEFIFGKYDDLLLKFGAGHLFRQHQKPQRRPVLSAAQLEEKRLLEGCILASTIGVPNRALSLMRDVLALPAYRTSSYTQIWIPNAHMSGDSCGGNMVGCPEVGGSNPFLGGAILDSTLLPPPGMRLPYYDGGRSLQFLQARNAVRGWIRAALPLGSNDDVGQGYLHALVEAFLMSLYERGHGAFGEGGGKGSFFYTKRFAIGSGLNSPNLDFLPLVNIEDDELAGGAAVGECFEVS